MSRNILERFPMYVLRPHREIFEDEEGRTIIHTAKRAYVLDVASLEGDYFKRRLHMLALDLPYIMYPLKIRIDTMGELVNCKYKEFIDRDGNYFSYTPTTFYDIVYTKIKTHKQLENGKYKIWTVNCGGPYLVSRLTEYAGFIKYGKAFLLFELSENNKKKTRRKL